MEKIFIMNLGTTSFKFKRCAFEGENSDVLRRKACENPGYLGLEPDADKNTRRGDGIISTDTGKVTVWRLKTDEESVVAGCVREFLKAQ